MGFEEKMTKLNWSEGRISAGQALLSLQDTVDQLNIYPDIKIPLPYLMQQCVPYIKQGKESP